MIEVLIKNNQNGELFDISQLVDNIEWTTQMEGQPGKLTFDFIKDGSVDFFEGSPVSFKEDNDKIFYGWVFQKDRSKGGKIKVTAYNQLRYMKNTETYIFKGMTSDAIFIKVCQDFKIKYSIVNSSTYIVPNKIHDNKSLFDVVQYGIDKTLIDTGKWYILRDNFGTLEHVDLLSLRTNIIIGDDSLLLDYNYQSSIDSDTANKVKLARDNKTTKKRDVYIVEDTSNQAKWGVLQFHEVVTDDANEAQLKIRAEKILNYKNKVFRKLSLSKCIGSNIVQAGSGIFLSIKELGDISVKQFVIVTNAVHTYTNSKHIMALEVILEVLV